MLRIGNQNRIWRRRLSAAAAIPLLTLLPLSAQEQTRVQPQATPEDVLASLVHHAAVIFAGEVCAIRTPQGTAGPVGGGVSSARSDAVVVEFRVDVGLRGASIGSNYVLRMPLAQWEQAPPYSLHEHVLTFLKPMDATGLSGPVQGEADLAGEDLGVMPVDRANQADLTRLQRLVAGKAIPVAKAATPSNAGLAPAVTDVTTQAGDDTLVSGSSQGRMPELRNAQVPFLALIRDVTVLSAAETPPGSSAAATR